MDRLLQTRRKLLVTKPDIITTNHWTTQDIIIDHKCPRPATRWVFTLLGYQYGVKPVSMGTQTEQTLHPLGMRVWGRSNSPHTHLPMGEKYPAQN